MKTTAHYAVLECSNPKNEKELSSIEAPATGTWLETTCSDGCKLVQRVDIPDDGSVEGVCNDAWDAAAARGLVAPQEAA